MYKHQNSIHNTPVSNCNVLPVLSFKVKAYVRRQKMIRIPGQGYFAHFQIQLLKLTLRNSKLKKERGYAQKSLKRFCTTELLLIGARDVKYFCQHHWRSHSKLTVNDSLNKVTIQQKLKLQAAYLQVTRKEI